MAFWKRKGSAADSPTPTSAEGAASVGAGAPAAPATGGPGAEDRALDAAALLRGDAGEDSRSLDLLLDTIARVSASRDLESLLDFVVDASIEATGAERGFLVLMDDASGSQVVRVARERVGSGEKRPLGADVKYSTSVVQRVVDRQQPLKTTLQKDGEDLELGNSVFDLKLRAVMCVPLVPRGEGRDAADGTAGKNAAGDAAAHVLPSGALYVDSTATSGDFGQEDLALFHALAQHIAIALENAQLNLHSIERARLERSLEIAAEIQSGLMPKAPPSIDGFDLFGWYRSAEHASGDFYDFVRTKGGGVAAVVGDVTGHGVGPALVTATAQASLRSYTRVLDDPGQVVTMLNGDLSERMDTGMFLTLFVADLESDGKTRVINAGHAPPLLWRASTKTIEALPSHGPALGLLDDMEYAASEPIQLEEGDVLLAFTDGLVEARNPSAPERFFDEQGVRAVLS
ncbi:MAG: GAF domain-containing SpoIIE family protein phosphatase, partial [Planctomycetota bacterium]